MTYNAANELTTRTYSDGTNTLRVDDTYDRAGDVLARLCTRIPPWASYHVRPRSFLTPLRT